MLRIAIQAKGRLNEQSIELLSEAGIRVAESKRKLISRAGGFPLEVLYLRDDDIPQAVAMGVADLGIVGLNEVAEKGFRVEQAMDLGFGNCRISLAVERTVAYEGLDYFRGKRVATSYPNILTRFFAEKGIDAEIHTIEGSVEIAPAVGMSDAIFDIVSSGGTLISNGLTEVEKVFFSEAVLIANPEMDEAKRRETAQLTFRFNSILESRGMKYVLMNLPAEKLQEAIVILPGMRSPTILPLAQEGWSSIHVVINERELWSKIEQLKAIGLCDRYEDVGRYIWHGGAHHVGWDTHDLVDVDIVEPGMVFCVDIGIYCEEWGIGFRLEDNCLVTEDSCENLTASIPRTIEEIESVMGGE